MDSCECQSLAVCQGLQTCSCWSYASSLFSLSLLPLIFDFCRIATIVRCCLLCLFHLHLALRQVPILSLMIMLLRYSGRAAARLPGPCPGTTSLSHKKLLTWQPELIPTWHLIVSVEPSWLWTKENAAWVATLLALIKAPWPGNMSCSAASACQAEWPSGPVSG